MVELPSKDAEFERWTKENPYGFVVNAHKSHAVPMMWHRADCGHLHWDKETVWVQGPYLKACSTDPGDLAVWAKDRTEELKYCKDCQYTWAKEHSASE